MKEKKKKLQSSIKLNVSTPNVYFFSFYLFIYFIFVSLLIAFICGSFSSFKNQIKNKNSTCARNKESCVVFVFFVLLFPLFFFYVLAFMAKGYCVYFCFFFFVFVLQSLRLNENDTRLLKLRRKCTKRKN